jgi:hypothetical protein
MHARNLIQTTQAQQAAFAIQALAVAAAVGYQRIGFYQMIDDNPCNQSAVWGIARDDGTLRPVAASLRTAIRNFSGFSNATFAPLTRHTADWSAWPDDPNSLIPNWQVYNVVFDLPKQKRVTVLWNGDGVALRVRIPRHSTQVQLIDMHGDPVADPDRAGSDWVISLPPATAHYSGDPSGYYFIGGEPKLLIETGVPPETPVTPPVLT